MANEVATKNQVQKQETKNSLLFAANKICDFYITDLTNMNAAVGVPMTDESKRCAVNVLITLCAELKAEVTQRLPKDQMMQILQFVTINGLDIFSGQVFLDKRKDKAGNIAYIKATPMGSAYEIMTAKFGVKVKTVHPARIVHEGDEFELPQFDGLKMTNVKHKMTLEGLDGKAIAVYYNIEKTDGTLDFAIATRQSVAKNLMAQILNASLRDANVIRTDLMKHLEGKTLDELLSDPYLEKWISPAYRSPASREQMIVTKMKKNALMHYTRDLGASQNKAFEKVNSEFFNDGSDNDSDMVVSYQDGEEEAPQSAPKAANAKPNQPAQKEVIQDFDVDDENDETLEAEEKPAETPKIEEKPANPAPIEAKPQEVEKDPFDFDEPYHEEPKPMPAGRNAPSVFDFDADL